MASTRISMVLLCVAVAMQVTNACVQFERGEIFLGVVVREINIRLHPYATHTSASLIYLGTHVIGIQVLELCTRYNSALLDVYGNAEKFLISRRYADDHYPGGEVNVKLRVFYSSVGPILENFHVVTDGNRIINEKQ